MSFLCEILFGVEILTEFIACIFHVFPFHNVKVLEFALQLSDPNLIAFAVFVPVLHSI